MKNILVTMLLACALAFVLPTAVQAQPCTPSYPAELHLGESACIRVCQFSLINFFLVGADLDEAGIPVISARAGCSPTNTDCNVTCNAITPPSIFTLGGGIFFPSPTDWGGFSDCMEIAYRWNHDGYWEIEIFSLCAGCFCLSFDDQLAAELSSFDAVAGDQEVTVSWTTQSETSMDRFEILRNGEKVYQVAAANSAVAQNYSWIDGSVLNGVTYGYTLQGVDISGLTSSYGTVSATPGGEGVVTKFALEQNYPNPFNPETSISFSLPEASEVSLRVFNLVGQEVATLVSGSQAAGTHVVSFDASQLTSGMYIYRLEAGEFSATRKMILMK